MDKNLRNLFLTTLIGTPYEKNGKGPHSYDCWHLAVKVEDTLFGRTAPQVDVPKNATWNWMIEQFTTHSELQNWVEVLQPNNGLVVANDGAIILMARSKQPAHCGVWLKEERRVIHADEGIGVVMQDLATLRANSWNRLRFYEPR